MSDPIDLEQVRAVIRLAEESDLAELDVESPALRVRVRRPAAGGAGRASRRTGTEPAAGPGNADARLGTEEADGEDLEPIIAPMVGTFYRSATPDAPPFVNEGDLVEAGQVVCIIEAMKLFNEIQAEKRGRVARILVENAAPVEYGQPLLLLDTTAA
jgi:acetyl-CoA carboxylase biotin carboxyl carrier protein